MDLGTCVLLVTTAMGLNGLIKRIDSIEKYRFYLIMTVYYKSSGYV